MRSICLVLFFSLVCLPGIAQTSARNDELKFDADYFLMRQEFSKALDVYLNILRSEPDNADLKHRIGICYLNSENDKEKAIPYLEEAVKMISVHYNTHSFKEIHAPIEAYFLLGSAYRVNNRLEEAVKAYEKYKEYLDPRDKYNQDVTSQYIKSCQLAMEMLKQPRPVTFINLGKIINNDQPNFNAVISGDGKIIAYTTPGRLGFEIFQSVFNDSTWSVPKNITSQLGTGKYMKTCSLSHDGTTMILVQEDPENSDLFMSHFKKGRWAKVEPMKKPINSKGNETHASLSPDGKTIYFTSVRKGGLGDLDIYRSTLQGESWGKPENLGPDINTPYNEETPFISSDGNVLYFSSEGHNGIGGFDVFRYDFRHPEAGAVNLGYPINTTDNNLFYVPLGDDTTAYYSFRGPDTYGGRDIYLVKLPAEKKEEAPPEAVTAQVTEAPKDSLVPSPAIEPQPADTASPTIEPQPADTASPTIEPQQALTPSPAIEQQPADSVPVTVTAAVKEAPLQSDEAGRAEQMAEARQAENVRPARSYTVQFMALKRPVDLQYFKELTDIAVIYRPDAWYRYVSQTTTDSLKSKEILKSLVDKGFADAFVRRKSIVPRFTIQVMAVPGPVTDLTRFRDLPDITARRGSDTFCRYTTGEYELKRDALEVLKQVRSQGYRRAFVRKIRTL